MFLCYLFIYKNGVLNFQGCKEVGLGEKEEYVREILTSPVQGATNTILSILRELGSRFETEAVFEAKQLCGNPTSVFVGSATERIHGALSGILSLYYSPGSTANCLISSTTETSHHLKQMATIKLTNDFNQTTNLVRAGYAVIAPAVACISRYILTGEKTELTLWRTDQKKVPRITNGGRKRRRTLGRTNTRTRTKRRRARTRTRTRTKRRRARTRTRTKRRRARARTRARTRTKRRR